ncbi:hypothetical protein L1049_000279 [Liquidambar formosana]|uniref:Cation efflux protein transmembrane domain-containing protein n=1 Tax=Liquidambar formosana TaxID=63359 RepID=A0AAP0NA58_LIQFO
MADGLRTESLDYRTELLSPAAAGENVITANRPPSWRISFDEYHLPENRPQENVLQTLRKKGKIAEYYKRQEKLLKGFNEVDEFTELGLLPGSLTENKMRVTNFQGIIVFASVMATLGLQILFESGRELVIKTQPERDAVKERWMIGIMVSVTVVKFVLMAYCRKFKNEIVRAYAQDHFFDVVTNSVGLAAAVLAIRFYWWIDPIGAIIDKGLGQKYLWDIGFTKVTLCILYSGFLNRDKSVGQGFTCGAHPHIFVR